MSYTLHPDAPLTDAVRDVARDQIDAAVEALEGASGDLEEAVHDTRKRCKKLRGLLRLVRPGLGKTYAKENAAFRELARTFSDIRDAQVLVQTIDGLAEHAGAAEAGAAGCSPPSATGQPPGAKPCCERTPSCERIDAVPRQLARTRKRAARWDVARHACQALKGGLKRSYARARSRWHDATTEARPSSCMMAQAREVPLVPLPPAAPGMARAHEGP